jgi:hypothetical protein
MPATIQIDAQPGPHVAAPAFCPNVIAMPLRYRVHRCNALFRQTSLGLDGLVRSLAVDLTFEGAILRPQSFAGLFMGLAGATAVVPGGAQ